MPAGVGYGGFFNPLRSLQAPNLGLGGIGPDLEMLGPFAGIGPNPALLGPFAGFGPPMAALRRATGFDPQKALLDRVMGSDPAPPTAVPGPGQGIGPPTLQPPTLQGIPGGSLPRVERPDMSLAGAIGPAPGTGGGGSAGMTNKMAAFAQANPDLIKGLMGGGEKQPPPQLSVQQYHPPGATFKPPQVNLSPLIAGRR